MTTVPARLGWMLRRLADRIDPSHGPRSPFSFTFEPRGGIKVHWDGRGCPLWYFGDADYSRAHDEGGCVVVIPRETPRLVTSADLGLTSEDLMTLASKPGPSVLDTMRNQPIDAVTALRALQDRLRDAPWGSC